MEIKFEPRPIYRAPIAVLRHLYYYTTQYGLSVKQFTGAHWRYWEELPERLIKTRGNTKKLNSIISELKKLASGSEERLNKRRAQLTDKFGSKEGKWEGKEIVLNAQLLSVLGALPGELLSLGFKHLTGDPNIPKSFQIVDLIMKSDQGEDTDFVEPDLLLLGGTHLLMVEVKTRGGADSSRSYPRHQLLNYLRLVSECRNSFDISLPREFTHLILMPSTDPKWLENHSEWVLQICDGEGKLKVNPSALLNSPKKKPGYDYQQLKLLATQVPIYYRSWDQLHEAFQRAVEQFGDKRNDAHWDKIVREIGALSQKAGKYAQNR